MTPQSTSSRYAGGSRLLLGFAVPLILVALWWLGSAHGWISSQVFPTPSQVVGVFVQMSRTGELLGHISASLYRVMLGFSLGASVGLLLGLAMGYWTVARELLYPTFRLIAVVPILGWLPFLMLLLGIDEALKVILIAKAALIPVTLNTYQGVKSVPASYREVASLYGFSAWQVVWRILLPSALPSIWSGIRFGLSHCWMALVLVELLSSTQGLGYLMFSGQQLMQMDLVVAAVTTVGLIGLALDRLLEAVEQRLMRWRPSGVRS